MGAGGACGEIWMKSLWDESYTVVLSKEADRPLSQSTLQSALFDTFCQQIPDLIQHALTYRGMNLWFAHILGLNAFIFTDAHF